ncbi:MAG TPA: hypothetical protein VHV49_17060 [Pseudonocardiaceae bacterium]|nr:hypothetical protein [Pseudonocardiaceae bacterium]
MPSTVPFWDSVAASRTGLGSPSAESTSQRSTSARASVSTSTGIANTSSRYVFGVARTVAARYIPAGW